MATVSSKIPRFGLLIALLSASGTSEALDRPSSVTPRHTAAELFVDGEARARVRDDQLIGEGYERIERLANGGLRVLRIRDYHSFRERSSGKLVRLPERWQMRSTAELSSELRLVREDVTLSFHRSIDRALGRDASNRDLAWLFEWDRMRLIASGAGDQMSLLTTLAGHVVQRDRYAYPPDAVPIEMVNMAVSVALSKRARRFALQVMLPDGESHGVTAEVHRTRDPSGFARGYAVPLASLQRESNELTVVDMWLTSPFKRIFFPHHYYFVYASARPSVLLAAWGGDPDEPLIAVRER